MNNKTDKDIITLGEWKVISDENLLISTEKQVTLLPKVMTALEYFIEHPKRVITFDELNNAIWPNEVVGDNSIYNIIGQLRKSLGDVASKPNYIETISKKGYRLIADVTVDNDEISFENNNTSEPEKPQINSFVIRPRTKVLGFIFIALLVLLFSSLNYNNNSTTQIISNAEADSRSESLSQLAKQFLSLANFHQFKGGKENKLIAIDYYQKLVALNPNYIQAYSEIAYLNIELMSLIPNDKQLFYRKAVLASEKDNNQFLTAYINEIKTPNSKSNAVEQAFETLNQNSINVSVSTRIVFADFLFQKGKINKAIEQQEIAIDNCLSCAEIHRKLANSYMVNMSLEKAAKYFNSYHELSSYDYNNPIRIVSQGALSIRTLKTMHQWYENTPKQLNHKYQQNHLTLFYLNLGLFKKANVVMAKRDVTNVSDFFTLYTLAAVEGSKRNFTQSLKYLKRRHELFPQNIQFTLSLSIAYWMTGINETALTLLEQEVIAKGFDMSAYQLLHAALLIENNQLSMAKSLLIKAESSILNTENINANNHMEHAMIYAILGDKEKSLTSLASSLKAGWVSDFNLNWWRLEDNPFLSNIKHEEEFKTIVINYYEQLKVITSTEGM